MEQTWTVHGLSRVPAPASIPGIRLSEHHPGTSQTFRAQLTQAFRAQSRNPDARNAAVTSSLAPFLSRLGFPRNKKSSHAFVPTFWTPAVTSGETLAAYFFALYLRINESSAIIVPLTVPTQVTIAARSFQFMHASQKQIRLRNR